MVFNHTVIYSSFVPSFLSPWGLVMASDQPINTCWDPFDIDQLLQAHIHGGPKSLRMLDGIALLGMFSQPRHVRDAIHRVLECSSIEGENTGVLA